MLWVLFLWLAHVTVMAVPEGYFGCATFKGHNNWAELLMQLDCERRMPVVSECCETHAKCYKENGGKLRCDQQLCDCNQRAVYGNALCQRHVGMYCEWIKSDRLTYALLRGK
ncbi:unnamed protein product, partial [Mesorhabditis spiculigera]